SAHRRGTGPNTEGDRSHVDIAFYTSSCGDGTVDTNNGAEQCETSLSGTACCNANCTFKNNATLCRAAATVCDVAENCTGSSATCPADAFASSATVCRASVGTCDVTENCTGSSSACPADAFASSAT